MSLTIEQLKFAREIGATHVDKNVIPDISIDYFYRNGSSAYISGKWELGWGNMDLLDASSRYAKIDFTPLDDYYADKAVDIAATSVPDGYYHDDEEDKFKPLKPAKTEWEQQIEAVDAMNAVYDAQRNPQDFDKLADAAARYRKAFGLDGAHDPALVEAEKLLKQKRNKYSREIKHGVFVDVYDVVAAWQISNPAQQHLAKKALQAGDRGHKSFVEDMRDIIASAERAIELFNNNERSTEVNK